MTARHHHYLSQFYLKGFSKGGSKKSKITVFDFKDSKIFETKARNIGGVRDFNKIESSNLDPNIIETSLSSFESMAAKAISEIEQTLKFNDHNRNIVLNLISLYAVRSPEKRENMRKFQENISTKVLDSILATKQNWDSIVEKMKADGYEPNETIDYNQIKDFHENKRYTIEVPTAQHIMSEMYGMDVVLKVLNERRWLVFYMLDSTEPFISSDNPVILTWNNPESLPPLYRSSPGFGMKNTKVFFPLSHKLFMVGEYEGNEGFLNANKELVSILNSMTISFAYRQIYSPKLDFHFMGNNNIIKNGSEAFDFFKKLLNNGQK